MNARFAPIVPDSPEPRAPLSMIPNFGHRETDEVAEYAQTCRVPLASPKAMGFDVPDAPDEVDEYQHITLKLGSAEVDVEWLMVAGCVYVQGATINDEFVDVDCFAKGVSAGWRRDIERSLGMGQ